MHLNLHNFMKQVSIDFKFKASIVGKLGMIKLSSSMKTAIRTVGSFSYATHIIFTLCEYINTHIW